MAAQSPFDNFSDWGVGLYNARLDSNAEFWRMDHSNLRTKPRHAVTEAMMVEKLWEAMGPQEHAWFSRFMPDVRQRYPSETMFANPWNVATAALEYGVPPLFDRAVIDATVIKSHPRPLEDCVPDWLSHRTAAGLATDCWQLTQELVASFHARDHLEFSLQTPYVHAVNREQLARLNLLCPSEDWTLALACAGIASIELTYWVQRGHMSLREQNALAWVQWWVQKSPNCMDNLAFAIFPKEETYRAHADTNTAFLMGICHDAQDARETFCLARQLYAPQATPALELPTDFSV